MNIGAAGCGGSKVFRFPNPSSTLSHLVNVYVASYEQYYPQVVDLDELVTATIAARLVTSSGRFGREALERSTRADRSRDPLYNQLKMYAELYKRLGWLSATETSAMEYVFTPLGGQLVLAGKHWQSTVSEGVIGIVNPTEVMSLRSQHEQRPFKAILEAMIACDYCLSRDEMIVGPLSVSSDQSCDWLREVVELVEEMRSSRLRAQRILKRVAAENRVSVNTLRNYTRWPIAVMRDLQWTSKEVRRTGADAWRLEFHHLTDLGLEFAQFVIGAEDIRIAQFNRLSAEAQTAFGRHCHFEMLRRAGFNTDDVDNADVHGHPVAEEIESVLGVDLCSDFIMSPFQMLGLNRLRRMFDVEIETVGGGGSSALSRLEVSGQERPGEQAVPLFQLADDVDVPKQFGITGILEANYKESESHEETARAISESLKTMGQSEFYPLVCDLFSLLGFEAERSRAGVNAQRWDALVIAEGEWVPVEIKSPSEEERISPKAVRQALENKIMLLSRYPDCSHRETSSLIVGYKYPNDRAEMISLVDEIWKEYQIRIGVIDLRTLLHLASCRVNSLVSAGCSAILNMKGIMHV